MACNLGSVVQDNIQFSWTLEVILTFWRRNYFLNFSTPVYKM